MDRFDPFSADYLADPYPHLARARADAPVFYAADLDMWVVSRYADIEAIFTDPATFSAAIAQDPVFPLADEARTTLREGGFRARRPGPELPAERRVPRAAPPPAGADYGERTTR
jgi:cytochrome P450